MDTDRSAGERAGCSDGSGRRDLLATLGAAGAAALAGCSAPGPVPGLSDEDATAGGATGDGGTGTPSPSAVTTEPFADGFASPVGVAFPPDAGGRVLSFGEDAAGELYVRTAGEESGAVHRLSGTR